MTAPAPQSELAGLAAELGFVPEPPEPYVIDLDARGITDKHGFSNSLAPITQFQMGIEDVLARHSGERPAKMRMGGKCYAFRACVDGSAELDQEIDELLTPAPFSVRPATIADAHDEALADLKAQRAQNLTQPSEPRSVAQPSQIAELSLISRERLRDAASKLTETIDQAVMQALIDAYPLRLTRIELWGSLFAYKSDPQSGEAFLRDDSTNPDKTIWWRLKQGDDWMELPEGAMTSQRAGTLLDHQPTSKFAEALCGQERNFNPNYLRRTAIPRIESEIGLPISSSSNQAEPGFALVIGQKEMLNAQEGDRRGLRNREKRLDYLAVSAGYFAGETEELPSAPEYEETPQATSHAEKRRTTLREKKRAKNTPKRDDSDDFDRTVLGS